MGADYSVYFCASAIRHILENENTRNATNKIFTWTPENIMIPLHGFKTMEHLPYMRQLESMYGDYIEPDVKKGINNMSIHKEFNIRA